MEIGSAAPGAIEFSALTALMYVEFAPARTAADDGANVDGREAGCTLIGSVGCDGGSAGAAWDEGCC